MEHYQNQKLGLWKALLKEEKDQPQTWGKYLQGICLRHLNTKNVLAHI